MTRSYEIEALIYVNSQTTSRGGHETNAAFLTKTGERILLKLDGHTVAKLKRNLANALLPRSSEEGAAA